MNPSECEFGQIAEWALQCSRLAVAIDSRELPARLDFVTLGAVRRATGPGADRLGGFLENTDVHDAVQRAMRLPRS